MGDLKGRVFALLYRLKERSFWQYKLGFGICDVDVSQFKAKQESDIRDHLNVIYLLLITAQPKSILELGTRGGESTKVFLEYAREKGLTGRSIDLEAAPTWLVNSSNWIHSQGDDLEIGGLIAKTGHWPDGEKLDGLDLIFLDTSHEYEHTMQELELFFPHLNRGGFLVLHDTNLSKFPHRNLDGGIGYGWDNKRGVARALEDYFGISFDETIFFSKRVENGITHLFNFPWSNGLVIVRKM